MTEIMLPIHPKWCELIASGKKTIEARKFCPKCDVPFKVDIYCTKPSKKYQTVCGCMILNSDELFRLPTGEIKYGDSVEMIRYDNYTADNFLNGKVIGEFVCRNTTCIQADIDIRGDKHLYNTAFFGDKTCLSDDELFDYIYSAPNKTGWGWHISDLIIYDKPKKLSDFKKLNGRCYYSDLGYAKPICSTCRNPGCMLSTPPKSFCYVERTW